MPGLPFPGRPGRALGGAVAGHAAERTAGLPDAAACRGGWLLGLAGPAGPGDRAGEGAARSASPAPLPRSIIGPFGAIVITT